MSGDDGVQVQVGDSDESPNLTIDFWLHLIILVFISTNVNCVLGGLVCLWRSRHMNIFTILVGCLSIISDLWTGWHAYNSLSGVCYIYPVVIFAAGFVFLELLVQMQYRWGTGTLDLVMSAGNFFSGLWLYYAKALPVLKTPDFVNLFTFIGNASISTIKMYRGFQFLREM